MPSKGSEVLLCMSGNIPITEKTTCLSTVTVIWTKGNHRGDLIRPIKNWNFHVFLQDYMFE